jgi:hypothetical protein
MYVTITLEGFDALKDALVDAPLKLKKAMKLAMARTGNAIRDAEIAEMKRVFDRPTRWTLGAMRVSTSSGELEVTIGIIDPNGNYKRAQSYLSVQVEGGPRRTKAFEVALQQHGLMPTGWRAVPGEGAKIDAFGNMSAGQIRQILSWFDAAERTAGSTQNMGFAGREKRRKGTRKNLGFEYFVVLPGRQRNLKQPGIYQRIFLGHGKSIKPILIYVKSANYKKRFDFEKVARETYDRVMPIEFQSAVEHELRK